MTTETLAEIQVSYKPGLTSSITTITNSQNAYEIFKSLFPAETISLQEQFVVLYLNKSNKVIGAYPLSKRGITDTIADVRLILCVALKTLATGLIIAHNHPSGNLKPSEADVSHTKKIKETAELMDIHVFDHIILADSGYFSFSDEGIPF